MDDEVKSNLSGILFYWKSIKLHSNMMYMFCIFFHCNFLARTVCGSFNIQHQSQSTGVGSMYCLVEFELRRSVALSDGKLVKYIFLEIPRKIIGAY